MNDDEIISEEELANKGCRGCLISIGTFIAIIAGLIYYNIDRDGFFALLITIIIGVLVYLKMAKKSKAKESAIEELIAIADKALLDKEWDKAIQYYTEAIEYKDVQGKDLFTIISKMFSETTSQEKLSTKSGYLNEKEAELYCSRGMAYCQLKKFDLALQDYNKVINYSPNQRGFGYSYRARCYERMQEYKKAIEDYTSAIETSYIGALSDQEFRGDCYKKLKMWNSAIMDYSAILDDALYPSANTSLKRSYCYLQLQEYEKSFVDMINGRNFHMVLIETFVSKYGQEMRSKNVNPAFNLSMPLQAYNIFCDAMKFANNGEWEKTIQAYTEMIELCYKNTGVLGNLYPMRAFYYMLNGENEKSLQDIDEAMNIITSLYPQSVHELYLYRIKAKVFENIGNMETALENYTKAIPTNEPDLMDVGVFLERACLYNTLNKNDEAINDFSKAIELAPYPDIYIQRTMNYFEKKDYEKAFEDLNNVPLIKISSTAEQSKPYYTYFMLLNIGKILYKDRYYREQGKWDEAIEDMTAKIKTDPENDTLYSCRASYYAELKDFKNAISDYEQALKLNKHNIDAYQALFICYTSVEEIEKALAIVDKGLEVLNNEPESDMNKKSKCELYIYKASIYYFRSNWQEAIKNYTEAIKINPENYIPYFFRAGCYMQISEDDKSRADIQKVIDINGSYDFLRKLGLQDSIENNPDNLAKIISPDRILDIEIKSGENKTPSEDINKNLAKIQEINKNNSLRIRKIDL